MFITTYITKQELSRYVLFLAASETSPAEDLAHRKDLGEDGTGGDALAVCLKLRGYGFTKKPN